MAYPPFASGRRPFSDKVFVLIEADSRRLFRFYPDRETIIYSGMSLPPCGTLHGKETLFRYPYAPSESGGRCFIQFFRMAEPAGQAVGYDILMDFAHIERT